MASGLTLCSEWNGRQIGTCYHVADIDGLAQQLIDAFGGSACAKEWACASLATCYFSSNPTHWCAHIDKADCVAAFDACDVSHIVVPDYPPALAPDNDTVPPPDQWVDPNTADSFHTKVVNGEELVLVFSDEFEEATRDFRPGKDEKWEVMDTQVWHSSMQDEVCMCMCMCICMCICVCVLFFSWVSCVCVCVLL